MRIDYGGLHVLVAQEFLDGACGRYACERYASVVVAGFEGLGSEGMAESAGADRVSDASGFLKWFFGISPDEQFPSPTKASPRAKRGVSFPTMEIPRYPSAALRAGSSE